MGGNDADHSNQGSSSGSKQEKGIRSKRKYLTDVLRDAQVDASALSLTEFPRYELLENKFRNALWAIGPRYDELHEEEEVDDFQPAEWDDPLQRQFEELLSNNLFLAFKSAIKKISESGYNEGTSELIVLRGGLCYGTKDVVSNIVDGALALLKSENELDISVHHTFENLQSLVAYTMMEMICVLREVRPSLTVVEAMWCLLMCDLNLSHACAVETDHLGSLSCQTAENLADPTNVQLKSGPSESSPTSPNDKSTSKPSNSSAHSEASEIGHASHLSISRSSCVSKVGKPGKEGLVPLPQTTVKSSSVGRDQARASSQASVAEEKAGGSRKGLSTNSKRDMLRQKSFLFEKSYKGRMSKGAFKAKISAWGNMVVDRSAKSPSGSSGVVMKSTYSKITSSVGVSGSVSEEIHHQASNSASLLSAFDSPGMMPMKDTVFALPAVNAKTLASSAPEPKGTAKAKVNNPSSSGAPDYYAGIPFDKTQGKYVSGDEKDATILMLVPHMQALQKEIQSWTDWANKKVMQATLRLSKDQLELKTLRQEKDEAEKFRKEKQALEENAIKRLAEMNQAKSNAMSQIDVTNSILCRLEAENSELRREMEAAKLRASGSATNLQQAVLREQEVLKNSQSWDLEKGFLQEDLTNLKPHTVNLEHQVERAKCRFKQFEALWKKEDNEKLEATSKAKSIRSRRERLEALAKAEQDDVKQKSESDLQKCREEIEKLETEISVLRFESDSSRIAALRTGIGMDYSGCGKGSKSVHTFRGLQSPSANKSLGTVHESYGDESMNSERECVMCLTEEMSIVFLPCAHQVLCAQCNDLHEKQGMNDCPSCRTLIQRRIHVRYANS